MRDEQAIAQPPATAVAPSSPPRARRYLPRLPRLPYRPTLLGRSVLLLVGEMVANVALWITAACTFGTSEAHKGVLSLCVVAWTLGLRHGLGAYSALLCTSSGARGVIAADIVSQPGALLLDPQIWITSLR